MEASEIDQQSSEVADVLSTTMTMLDEAAAHLDGFSKEVRDGRPALHRANAGIELGRALVGLADPTTTARPVADNVRANAETLRDQLALAVADGVGGDIGGPAEGLLAALGPLRQPNALTEEAAKEAALKFKQSLDPRLRGMKTEIDRIEAMLREVSESTASEVGGIAERLDGLKGEVDASEKRVQDLISDQDAKFTEAQEERRKEFGEAIKEAESELDNRLRAVDDRRDAAFKRLGEIEADVAETAASIGGRATSLGHGAESIAQAKLAHRWTVTTIVLLLAAAIIPLSLGVLHAKQSPESVAGKITIALIIAGVASYAAGIARHHRERSASARRMELEMTSFEPFIAPLEKDDRNDLRSTIIWRFFGPEAVAQQPDSPPRPGKDLREILHLRSKKNGESEPPPA